MSLSSLRFLRVPRVGMMLRAMIYLQLEIYSSGTERPRRAFAEAMVSSRSLSGALEQLEAALAKAGWRSGRVLETESFVGCEDAAILRDPLLYARAKFTGSALRVARTQPKPALSACPVAA